jgi:ABC-type bacteriocin/lantibiotic exporter with double-glycine peptidase domain
MRRGGIWLLLPLAVWGCSPFRRVDWENGRSGVHIIENVPFYRQAGPYDCGPAALASLLAHRGRTVAPESIAGEVTSPILRGSLLPDLENFAGRQGFATRSGRGDLALLRQAIEEGCPVLIPLEMGIKPVSSPHYIVVFGYDQKGFLVHAGEKAAVFIEADELDRRWAVMNRLFLLLEGKET